MIKYEHLSLTVPIYTTPVPEVINAREILRQAGDYIESSFWIQDDQIDNNKFMWESVTTAGTYNWEPSLSDHPVVAVKAGDVEDVEDSGFESAAGAKVYSAVTGVCSIGALALANAAFRDDYYRPYEELCRHNFDTRLAGEVLAQVIQDTESGEHLSYVQMSNGSSRKVANNSWHNLHNTQPDHASIIAEWNDGPITREDCVALFRVALEHPLLDATEIWTFDGAPRLIFGSKLEAAEFAENEEDSLRRRYYDVMVPEADARAYMLLSKTDNDPAYGYFYRDETL